MPIKPRREDQHRSEQDRSDDHPCSNSECNRFTFPGLGYFSFVGSNVLLPPMCQIRKPLLRRLRFRTLFRRDIEIGSKDDQRQRNRTLSRCVDRIVQRLEVELKRVLQRIDARHQKREKRGPKWNGHEIVKALPGSFDISLRTGEEMTYRATRRSPSNTRARRQKPIFLGIRSLGRLNRRQWCYSRRRLGMAEEERSVASTNRRRPWGRKTR